MRRTLVSVSGEPTLPREGEFLEDHLRNWTSEPHCRAGADRRKLLARRQRERNGRIAHQSDRGRRNEPCAVDDEVELAAATRSSGAGRKADAKTQ